ncbi:MAG TPA: hypothetical protein VGN82_04575 [Bosea sp. (in: a-proteobacteria)]|jgi:hypothetical protein|uniref:hypothetical protein n=1 Tax=Bosea sp. (in: a-proteobacteria) TaxID=1871050 RepID=UPI002E141735|nr:hypothetical protein [Bosea sp. (in: a-proteobacteria)]
MQGGERAVIGGTGLLAGDGHSLCEGFWRASRHHARMRVPHILVLAPVRAHENDIEVERPVVPAWSLVASTRPHSRMIQRVPERSGASFEKGVAASQNGGLPLISLDDLAAHATFLA